MYIYSGDTHTKTQTHTDTHTHTQTHTDTHRHTHRHTHTHTQTHTHIQTHTSTHSDTQTHTHTHTDTHTSTHKHRDIVKKILVHLFCLPFVDVWLQPYFCCQQDNIFWCYLAINPSVPDAHCADTQISLQVKLAEVICSRVARCLLSKNAKICLKTGKWFDFTLETSIDFKKGQILNQF